MLFINGALQQTALYAVAAGKLTIHNPASSVLAQSALITLNVTNFAPNSVTTITG